MPGSRSRTEEADGGSAQRGECAVVVMARAPRPGKVKTRLCPPLTNQDAAAFYECLLEDSLRNLSSSEFWDLWIAYPDGTLASILPVSPAPGLPFSVLSFPPGFTETLIFLYDTLG